MILKHYHVTKYYLQLSSFLVLLIELIYISNHSLEICISVLNQLILINSNRTEIIILITHYKVGWEVFSPCSVTRIHISFLRTGLATFIASGSPLFTKLILLRVMNLSALELLSEFNRFTSFSVVIRLILI